MTLTFISTVGLVQISSVFAAPLKGGNPHGDFGITSSTGDPHSLKAPKGNPHICETIESGGSESSGAGAGKVVFEQC
ncbi:MAG: hypothetical protein ACTHJ7_03515 [Candidatus Nitrosocosmicus sp.]